MSLDITQDILTQAVAEVTEEYGRVNLSALGRRLPLTREQLKRLKRNGFIIKPNGNLGKHLQIAIGNGHLCHVQRPANDMISGQPGTYYAAKFL